ncbi:MAG: hypothetical protein AAB481_02140 [Patescibacteria group bacterium]
MNVQIDQSNKVEQTEKDTVIALSNGVKFSVLIRAKDKRVIQNEFRLRGQPRNFTIFTFSMLLVFLLKKVKPRVPIVIDLEYKDKENIIREKLILYSKRFAGYGQSGDGHSFSKEKDRASRGIKECLTAD